MSNIATLGLEFTTKGAENKIKKLCDAFDELSKKSDSIETVFKSLSTFKPLNDTFITQIASLSKSFSTLKGISPEITESVKTFFASFESIKTVDAAVIDSIAKLGAASSQFKVINPGVATSVDKLFSSIGNNLPNVDAPKTEAIAKLGVATSQFKVIKPEVATSVDKLFQTITNVGNIKYNTVDTVARLGEGLSKFKAIKPDVSTSVKNLFDTLNKLQPLSVNLRMSIKMLTDMFNSMAVAGKNASSATKTLGNSMGYAQTQTDGLSIAFRTLQGAVSLNFFKSATAQAVEFGTELAQLKSIASELNTSQIGKGVMNFSSVLGNPRENLEALYYAYSSGIRGTEDDFLKFTDIVKKTAVVNRASVIPMADAMTAAMNAYGLSVDHAGQVADTFYSIVKYGKASGEQLANSFGQVSPTAKTLGVSLDELGAAIASLTKIQPTRVAITGLNNMLSKIMKPTKESRLALQKLGVDMSYSAVQSKGFVKVLEEVREALNGDAEAIKNIFPDIRGQRAAMHLLGAGWEDFKEQLKNFKNKKGSMEDAFKTMKENTAVQLAAIPETIKKIVTETGSMATSFVTLGGKLTPIIAAFNNMSEGARKFFAGITLIVGGYVAYKTAMFALQSLQAIQLKNEAALAAAQTAKLAQLQAEVALRSKLASLSGANLFQRGISLSEIASSRAGFGKGFGAALNSKKWTRDWIIFARNFTSWGRGISPTTKHLLHLRIVSGTFAKALTGLGAILGKLVGVVGAIFSPLGLMVSGIIALGDVTQAVIRSGSFTNYGDKLIATDIFEGIYNWWTDATKKAEALDGYIQRTMQNIADVKRHKELIKAGDDSVRLLIDDLFTQKTENKQSTEYKNNIQKMIGDWAKAKKHFQMLDKQQEEANKESRKYDQELQEAIKNSKTTWGDWVELGSYIAAGTVGAFFATIATAPVGGIGGMAVSSAAGAAIIAKTVQMTESANAQEAAQERFNKAQEKVLKIKEQAAQGEEKYIRLLENLKRELPKQVDFFKEQIANLQEIKTIFEQHAIVARKGDNKISLLKDEFAQNISTFNENLINGETKAMLKSLNAATKNYKTIRDAATKIGENMAELQMEGMLMGAKNDAQKQAIYSQKGINAFKEMKTALASGNLTAASKSLNVYIQNTKNAIAIQKKLADAEKQANNKTLQMIQSLDKFKVTAMEFVDANSTDAMKLQSRQFGALPKFTPLTAQQTSAQAANDKLATAIATYTQQISKAAEREKNNAESQWSELQRQYSARITALESKLNGFLLQTSTALKTIVDAENKRQNQADNTKETNNLLADIVDNQKNVANNLQQISSKLNRGIEITNLKTQKAFG